MKIALFPNNQLGGDTDMLSQLHSNKLDPEAFRQVLVKAGFYDKWKQKYGAAAWAMLQEYTGRIGT